MEKRVTILVIIALVLAVAAIALNATSSEEVSTKAPSQDIFPDQSGAQVGVGVQAPAVEDKTGGAQ
jgi:hypothetical protein